MAPRRATERLAHWPARDATTRSCEGISNAPARATMRSLAVTTLLLATISSCVGIDDEIDEDLGDIGDGKADSFGVVDRAFTVGAGKTKRFSFTANASFRIAITQPDTAATDRSKLALTLKKPDASRITADP